MVGGAGFFRGAPRMRFDGVARAAFWVAAWLVGSPVPLPRALDSLSLLNFSALYEETDRSKTEPGYTGRAGAQ